MKNLTGVLVFSTALLLAVGCHKNTGEGPGPTDASAQPDPRDAMEAIRDAGAPSDGAQTGTSRGALTSDAGTTSSKDAGGMSKGSGGGDRQAQEACVDQWLEKHGLDRYGSPEGTMYAGGTPLFDERTGETKDRLEFIFQRKPEARQACAK